MVLGTIFTTFPEPRELAKAIGFFSFVAAAGGAQGPIVGGVLTQAMSWRWIFFVNVPVGVAGTALAACSSPGSASPEGPTSLAPCWSPPASCSPSTRSWGR